MRSTGAAYFANDRAPTVPAALAPKIADILRAELDRAASTPRRRRRKSQRRALEQAPAVTTGAFTRITRSSHGDGKPARRALGVLAGDVRPQISGPLGITNLMEPQDSVGGAGRTTYSGLARFSQCCNPAHLATGIAGRDVDRHHRLGQAGLERCRRVLQHVQHRAGTSRCTRPAVRPAATSEMTAGRRMGRRRREQRLRRPASGKVFRLCRRRRRAWSVGPSCTPGRPRSRTTRRGSRRPASAARSPILAAIGKPSMSDFTDVTRSMTAMGWTLVASCGRRRAATRTACAVRLIIPQLTRMLSQSAARRSFSRRPLGYQKETAWGGNACANPDKPTNNGGGGGGCSDTFPATAWNPKACTNRRRAIPDFSLNGGGRCRLCITATPIAYTDPVTKKSFKNICGRKGTSIAAPEVAGFFVQENAYLLTLGNNCGPSHDAPCAPLGRAGPILFAAPKQPHDPFYDITTGKHFERTECRI